jgi:hypothetical protein
MDEIYGWGGFIVAVVSLVLVAIGFYFDRKKRKEDRIPRFIHNNDFCYNQTDLKLTITNKGGDAHNLRITEDGKGFVLPPKERELVKRDEPITIKLTTDCDQKHQFKIKFQTSKGKEYSQDIKIDKTTYTVSISNRYPVNK